MFVGTMIRGTKGSVLKIAENTYSSYCFAVCERYMHFRELS